MISLGSYNVDPWKRDREIRILKISLAIIINKSHPEKVKRSTFSHTFSDSGGSEIHANEESYRNETGSTSEQYTNL